MSSRSYLKVGREAAVLLWVEPAEVPASKEVPADFSVLLNEVLVVDPSLAELARVDSAVPLVAALLAVSLLAAGPTFFFFEDFEDAGLRIARICAYEVPIRLA